MFSSHILPLRITTASVNKAILAALSLESTRFIKINFIKSTHKVLKINNWKGRRGVGVGIKTGALRKN